MIHGMVSGLLGSGQRAASDQVLSGTHRTPVERSRLGTLLWATLRFSVALVALVAMPTLYANSVMNDTGVDQCGDVTTMSAALCTSYSSDQSAYPRQDANLGRDAMARAGTLGKTGLGSKGFDFTKIANNGADLPASAAQGAGATDWACTRDNVTGLVWEVKTTSGLHSASSTYSWYQAGLGTSSGGSCQNGGRCDTEKFVADVNDVNAAGFCGSSASLWRMPTVKELEGLADFGNRGMAIETAYFPGTSGTEITWTGTPDMLYVPAQSAWMVKFTSGGVAKAQFANTYKVRLVRGAPVSRQFILNADTVLDTGYGLMWKLQYEMKNPGHPASATSGNPDTFTWSDALMRAVNDRTGTYSDWRLPNVKELRSLVDEGRVYPAIDPIFPALLPGSDFWSSSPAQNFAGYTNLSWIVQFDTGGDLGTTGRSAQNYVRLVRDLAVAEQAIGPISFSPTSLAVGGTTTASAAGGASGNTVTFSSETAATCTVTSGGLVTGVSAGTCIVAANQAGNLLYAPAPQVAQSITVGRGSQTIGTIAFTSTFLAVGGTTTVSATASSGLAVSFSSSVTPTICSVSGNTVTGLVTGTCTVTASQTGNANYVAATPVTQNIAVKASQSIGAISFSPGTLAVGGATTASAAGGASGNPVTFSSTSATSICTVTGGGLVTGVGVGSCVVAANQAGNNTYVDASTVTASITVKQGSQTIGPISFTSASLVVGGTTTVNAVATSGLAVSFVSSPQSICTVNGGIVTGKSAGWCTVVANQAGNANYTPANPVAQNIEVRPGSQVISAIIFSPNTLAIGGTTTASATADSGLAVSFSSASSTTICTVASGGTVTGVGAGTCAVTASQPGNANYGAATPVTQNIVVKLGQTIGTISFAPTTLAVGGTTTASATGGASGNTVTFSSTSATSVCTVTSGGLVTGVGAGPCVVAADQAGTDTYAAAPQKTTSITVGQGGQTIGSITLSNALSVGGVSTASATTSSGLAVIFSSTSPANICTVSSGGSVLGVGIGTCAIAANQAGNANYAPATQVLQQFPVLANQNISLFSFTPTALAVGGTTTVGATGGASGNPVIFDSATPATCTLSGHIVTGVAVGVGACTITANQAGDGTNYAAANPAAKNITVGMGSQSINSFTFTAGTLNVGATAQASAAATSGYPVSFDASVTPTICSVSGTNGNIVAGDTPGICTITASQDGFQGGIQNYNAVSVQKNITVTATTVSFSPDALTFGPQYVGTTSAPKIITLTNTGGSRLNITSILPTLNVFAVPSNTCGSRVNAGASCTISVTFSPAAIGTRLGSIRVTSNSANGTDSFTVDGQGVANGAPICTLTAAPARIQPGRSSTLTANCSPAGTYSWTGGTCAGTTGSTCTVSPAATTIYGVTATNGQGTSNTGVVATVTVKPVDLTPILMLLLD